MAFDPKPNSWLDDWSEDGTNITVPIATFPELTAAEADGTTGDIRKVLFALCEKLATEWESRAAADRPARMTVTKSSVLNAAADKVTHSYTFKFTNAISAQEVDSEPA